jgi:asparagine synthase (glutamine-hydrolysing)
MSLSSDENRMSGIAGILLPLDVRPLDARALESMDRALEGTDVGPPLLLEGDRLALMARGAPGYRTGLLTRRQGSATLALAFHGLLVAGAAPAAGEAEGPAGQLQLEALLTRLAARGAEAFAEMRGEFALAFWDGRDGTLHLATDRFRIQSLLMSDRPSRFLFASRMASLLASPVPLAPTIDPAAVMDVVGSAIIATPRTIFREVEKVPPGHHVAVRNGRAVRRPYWDLDFTHADGASPEQLAADTREALDAAVADRLRGDLAGDRFGAFLSGGIDSTTVTGLLTRRRGGPVATFSIGFGEQGFDELSYARIAANSFRTRHTEYLVTARDTVAAMDAMAQAFDEPFANASAIPTYHCARLAREHGVDALYAGDGGDELFAGNERYASGRVFDRYARVPAFLRKPFLTPAIRAAGTLFPVPFLVKAKKYVQRASLSPAERIVSYGFWNVVPPRRFVDGDLLAAADSYVPNEMLLRHYDEARAATALDRQLYLDLKITISDNDVFKVTRACELGGVAVRFPFLDERVVDAAQRVPASLKMRGGELRTFFKEAHRELLPPEIRAKKKHGFGLPISLWLRTDPELHGMMRDLVLGPTAAARGYFQRPALEDLVRRHAEDPTPYYGTVLWNLMVLEQWHRRVLDHPRS